MVAAADAALFHAAVVERGAAVRAARGHEAGAPLPVAEEHEVLAQHAQGPRRVASRRRRGRPGASSGAAARPSACPRPPERGIRRSAAEDDRKPCRRSTFFATLCRSWGALRMLDRRHNHASGSAHRQIGPAPRWRSDRSVPSVLSSGAATAHEQQRRQCAASSRSQCRSPGEHASAHTRSTRCSAKAAWAGLPRHRHEFERGRAQGAARDVRPFDRSRASARGECCALTTRTSPPLRARALRDGRPPRDGAGGGRDLAERIAQGPLPRARRCRSRAARGRSRPRTRAASSTATSSPRTSCSSPTAR